MFIIFCLGKGWGGRKTDYLEERRGDQRVYVYSIYIEPEAGKGKKGNGEQYFFGHLLQRKHKKR